MSGGPWPLPAAATTDRLAVATVAGVCAEAAPRG